ncbi:MFS transporter [Natrialba swarupiae]|uniref:MFS transporter n=1 Tax=Natrialba swarupiae TaxID=2448032 RepID=A0A5D5AM75_9EURY|nr:MFS transporter [Natrialba swarupiae]TYT62113.1 MFS transporter [Natrialba swarupiae]
MSWRYRHTVLAHCTLAFFATMVGRVAISPIVPSITNEFTVSNTLIGASLTGMWLSYALVQYPSGILATRYGERRIILVSIGGTGIACLVLATAPRFEVFFAGTVLLGAVAGLHFSVATAMITRAFDRIGTPIAIHNAGGPIAGLCTPIAVSWIAVRYGWRPAIAATALVAAVVFVLFAGNVRETEPRRPEMSITERFQIRPLLAVLSRPAIAFTSAIAVLAEFVWTGLISFLPTFLIVYREYSSTDAGVLFAVYFLTLGILQIGVGSLSDRYGRNVATGTCMIAAIAGLAMLLAVPGIAAAVTGIVLLGFGMGWGASVFPQFMDHLSESERETGFGLVRTVYLVIASSGSLALGALADQFGWAVSFGTLIVSLVVVCVLLLGNWLRGTGY